MAKRGRKPQHWTDDQGNIYPGLGRRPDGRFYPIADRNKHFGKDPAHAVFRFRQWEAQERGEQVQFARIAGTITEALHEFFKTASEYNPPEYNTPEAVIDHLTSSLGQILRSKPDDYRMIGAGGIRTLRVSEDGQAADIWSVPADAVWESLRNLIITDPQLAAQKLGIPELRNLQAIKPPPPSLDLDRIGDLYANKLDLTQTESNRSLRWWKRFCKIIGVHTVREIEADHINLYHDRIIDEYRRKKWSPDWVKHRFGKIKTMFAHALIKGQDQEQISRVLALCKMLKPPRNLNGAASDPITTSRLKALLKHADKRETAIILLGLNCAFYPIDISRLPVSAIDLGKRTVIFDRTKTGNPIPRVAILWPRTVKAIKAYQAAYRHEATDKDGQPLLFANSEGRQLRKDTLTKWIKNLCDKADCKVVFSQLRDGGYTAVVDAGIDITQAEILLGHSIGKVKDAYLKRRPSIVADACEVVEKHYFGGR